MHRRASGPKAVERGRLSPVLAVLLAFPAFVQPAFASAPQASLCIVARSPADGLGFDDVAAAVDLEWRKSRLALLRRVVSAPAPEACPPDSDGPSALLLLTGTNAVLLGPCGATLQQDLGGAAPVDRGQEIARRVVGLFAAEVRRGHPLLVDRTRQPLATPSVAQSVVGPAGYVSLAGRYGYQPTGGNHRFATDLEGGLTLYDERLLVGLRAGFEPAQQAATDPFRIDAMAVPVTILLRGGGRVHPRILVRGALGAGIEWRQLEASVPGRGDSRRISNTLPLLEAEVEVAIVATGILRVSVAGVLRGFLGGEALSWQGRTVYDPPRLSVGLAVRLGAVLRDRRRP